MQWSVNNPQPSIIRDGKVYTVVDARRSVPPQCDYLADSGMGTYSGASYDSPVVHRPDGTTHIPDGTVTEVIKYSIGEAACNNGGNSAIWFGVKEMPGGELEWGWRGNFGGAPTLTQLNANHIPQQHSQYIGTTAPSC